MSMLLLIIMPILNWKMINQIAGQQQRRQQQQDCCSELKTFCQDLRNPEWRLDIVDFILTPPWGSWWWRPSTTRWKTTRSRRRNWRARFTLTCPRKKATSTQKNQDMDWRKRAYLTLPGTKFILAAARKKGSTIVRVICGLRKTEYGQWWGRKMTFEAQRWYMNMSLMWGFISV